MRKFIVVSLCLCLMGCAAETSIHNMRPFVDPQYGMTKAQLIELLGKPMAIQIYRKTDQTRVEFYIYVRKYQTSEEKVPVCLINNKIVGWGKTYYEDHIDQDDVRIK